MSTNPPVIPFSAATASSHYFFASAFEAVKVDILALTSSN